VDELQPLDAAAAFQAAATTGNKTGNARDMALWPAALL